MRRVGMRFRDGYNAGYCTNESDNAEYGQEDPARALQSAMSSSHENATEQTRGVVDKLEDCDRIGVSDLAHSKEEVLILLRWKILDPLS